jgi:hypothetical protein
MEQGDDIIMAEGCRALIFTFANRGREIAIQVGNGGLDDQT